MKEDVEKIKQEKSRWEEKTLKPALERFKLKESPTQFYAPSDLEDEFDFLEQVGFRASIPSPRGPTPLFPTAPGREARAELPRQRAWFGPGATPDTEPRKTPGIIICT